ncbi:hypothetical protein [uncultured Duncaniella sp.]|uniref:hypothetical protein n=1 Tax=uncultured Duncaniella sp. TaxID=2768039 RepID=UPI0025CE82A1|nr:hypothetical protein [uncultured Duncaniella sp.]
MDKQAISLTCFIFLSVVGSICAMLPSGGADVSSSRNASYVAKNRTNIIKDSVVSGLHGISDNAPEAFNASLNFDFKAEQRHLELASLW